MTHPIPCRTTQHCAVHGWCNRCEPAFAAVMDRVNRAIQHTDPNDTHWGELYTAIAREMRDVCICGHGSQQHAEDDCLTCDCGDYLTPAAAREVIARLLEAQGTDPGQPREETGARLARYIADQPISEIQAAVRILGWPPLRFELADGEEVQT